MKTLNKINQVIESIKKTNVQKEGRNDFSGYDYFTPAQIESICYDECHKQKLFYKFDLVRNELGIFGKLSVYDLELEKSEPVVYEMASDIPSIKATNVAQQLGGSMTYTKRYLLMNAFNITDNNLDPDTSQNTKKNTEAAAITWLTEEQFNKTMGSDVPGISATLEKYSTKEFKMKRDFKEKLEAKLNELI